MRPGMLYDLNLHLDVIGRLRSIGAATAGYSEHPCPPHAPDSGAIAGAYVAVDLDSLPEYVGKACRTTGIGLDDRVQEHPRARTATWHAVWLIPLYDDADVLGVEADLIRWLQPRQNKQRPARTGPLHTLLRNLHRSQQSAQQAAQRRARQTALQSSQQSSLQIARGPRPTPSCLDVLGSLDWIEPVLGTMGTPGSTPRSTGGAC